MNVKRGTLPEMFGSEIWYLKDFDLSLISNEKFTDIVIWQLDLKDKSGKKDVTIAFQSIEHFESRVKQMQHAITELKRARDEYTESTSPNQSR